MRRSLSYLWVLALNVGLLSAQSVLVVDEAGSPGSVLDVQAAIDLAVDGDLILIKPGNYTEFLIRDISITIVADGGLAVFPPAPGFFVGPTLDIRLLAANKTVNIAGIEITQGGGAFGLPGANIFDNEGQILMRDCSIISPSPRASSMDVVSTQALTLVDVSLDSGLSQMGYSGTDDSHGLVSEDSNLFVYGSTIASGTGQEGDFLDGTNGFRGAAGWRIRGGFGLGVRTTVIGGQGGFGGYNGIVCGDGGTGGPGLELQMGASAPLLVRSNVVAVPGAAGQINPLTPLPANCGPGEPGVQQIVFAGSIDSDPQPNRSLETEYLVRVGEVKNIVFKGAPTDLVWHVFGVQPASPVFIPEITGPLSVGTPNFVRFRGMIPASGEKALAITVPSQGFDYAVLYEQAVFYDFTRFHVSNPTFSVILSDSF
ncbi:MAG: hypothetical protein ACI8TQ_002200 [Planctomycetota bacterium]|jgi:hypothetical protein